MTDDRKLPNMLLTDFSRPARPLAAYDVGRRVGAIARTDFVAFEQAVLPYPLPMQHKAWFALVPTTADNPQDPADLVSAPVVGRTGHAGAGRTRLPAATPARIGAGMRAVPIRRRFCRTTRAFTPRQGPYALLHALLSADLGLAFATTHMRSNISAVHWDGISGVSSATGIADVACRHVDGPLPDAIAALPDELRSLPLPRAVQCIPSPTHSMRVCGWRFLGADRHPGGCSPIRSLSPQRRPHCPGRGAREVITHPIGSNIEILAAIGGDAPGKVSVRTVCCTASCSSWQKRPRAGGVRTLHPRPVEPAGDVRTGCAAPTLAGSETMPCARPSHA